MSPLLLPELFSDALTTCGPIGLQWLEHPFIAVEESGHRVKRKITRATPNQANAALQIHTARAMRSMTKALASQSPALALATVVSAYRSILIGEFVNRKFREPALISPFMVAISFDEEKAHLLLSPGHLDDVLAWMPTATGNDASDAAVRPTHIEARELMLGEESEGDDWRPTDA